MKCRKCKGTGGHDVKTDGWRISNNPVRYSPPEHLYFLVCDCCDGTGEDDQSCYDSSGNYAEGYPKFQQRKIYPMKEEK